MQNTDSIGIRCDSNSVFLEILTLQFDSYPNGLFKIDLIAEIEFGLLVTHEIIYKIALIGIVEKRFGREIKVYFDLFEFKGLSIDYIHLHINLRLLYLVGEVYLTKVLESIH